MNNFEIIAIVLIFFIISLFFCLKKTNIPKHLYRSEVIYADSGKRPEKPLFSSRYGLTGKPDFIMHTKNGKLPLEYKSSERPDQPYFSHVMQLISYCLLMEENGMRPNHGYIQYKTGKAFRIPYTNRLKAFLLEKMDEMQRHMRNGEGPRPVRRNKCNFCGHKGKCFE